MNQQSLSSSSLHPEHLYLKYFTLTSSPIHTEKNSQDLLAEFFDWLVKQPGCNNEQKIELYTKMKDTLVEEQWELDTL